MILSIDHVPIKVLACVLTHKLYAKLELPILASFYCCLKVYFLVWAELCYLKEW